MMQVNLIIPLFTVPEHADYLRILEEVQKFTGYDQLSLFDMLPIEKPKPKQKHEFKKKQSMPKQKDKQHLIMRDSHADKQTSKAKYICVEASDLNFSITEVNILASRVQQLERQNTMLRNDLAELYQRYASLHIQQVLDKQQQKPEMGINLNKQTEIQKNNNQQSQKYTIQQIRQYQKQIKELVSDKLSKQETIQKLKVYCGFLLKVIEDKKISIL